MNALTDESRDIVVSVNLSGVCTKLRAPSSLRFLFAEAKPNHLSIGDTILKDRLDSVLLKAICDGRYREVQRTLAAVLGPMATDVGDGYK